MDLTVSVNACRFVHSSNVSSIKERERGAQVGLSEFIGPYKFGGFSCGCYGLYITNVRLKHPITGMFRY